MHDFILIYDIAFYFFFNIFSSERGGNNPHPAPSFHYESVEGRRRGCLLHRESSYARWPPAPLPNPNAEDWRAGIAEHFGRHPAAETYYILD